MGNKRCELCKNKDLRYFVHDMRTDDFICTMCGCCQRNWFMSSENTNYNDPESNPKRAQSSALKTQMNGFHRLMVRAFPEEERTRKRNNRIKEVCELLDLSPVVLNRATSIYTEFKEELCAIRPIDHMLVACVVVAARSDKRVFLPMTKVNGYFDQISNISDLTKRVCKVVGINQRTMILNSVPYVTSTLGMPFKCEKQLTENYKKMCKLAPSMCGETKMALAACRTLKDNAMDVDLEFIAYLNDTSVVSIKGFSNKKRKRKLMN